MSDLNDIVLAEKKGHTLWLTINRPERRNSLTGHVFQKLRDHVAEADADPSVRAIVFTGAGDVAFSAGADLKPDTDYSPIKMQLESLNHPIVDLFRLLERCTTPTIARVNGVTMAGGMALLSMCDMAVAADHAYFALPEVKIGLFPLMIVPYLHRTIPRRLLNEMIYTGEPFDTDWAKEAGLLNYVVPMDELDEKVNWLADRIATKSPAAIRRGKHGMNSIRDMSLDNAFAYAQTEVAMYFLTDDFVEGVGAFNEKRKPKWAED